MFELFHGLAELLRLIRACVFPHGRPARELTHARAVTNGFLLIGCLMAVFGVGCYLWYLPERLDPVDPPTEIVSATDLTTDSFIGALDEALLNAQLQLPDARYAYVQPPSDDPLLARLNPPRGFIPLTGPEWQPGDVIPALLFERQLQRGQNASNVAALAAIGVPSDQGQRPAFTALVTRSFVQGDRDYVLPQLREKGLNVADGVLIVEAIDHRRTELVAQYKASRDDVGVTFLVAGVLFFAVALLLRIRLMRYLRQVGL